MTTGRVEAFSDGVIAIIITIMVLELRPPHDVTLAGLRPLLPVFGSYVMSYVYIGIYWSNHHHLLHAAQHVTTDRPPPRSGSVQGEIDVPKPLPTLRDDRRSSNLPLVLGAIGAVVGVILIVVLAVVLPSRTQGAREPSIAIDAAAFRDDDLRQPDPADAAGDPRTVITTECAQKETRRDWPALQDCARELMKLEAGL
jgi:hypothetical protein